jgi:hypothetical protein
MSVAIQGSLLFHTDAEQTTTNKLKYERTNKDKERNDLRKQPILLHPPRDVQAWIN